MIEKEADKGKYTSGRLLSEVKAELIRIKYYEKKENGESYRNISEIIAEAINDRKERLKSILSKK
jgi:uncharacterized protein YigE (DUF2233 family)